MLYINVFWMSCTYVTPFLLPPDICWLMGFSFENNNKVPTRWLNDWQQLHDVVLCWTGLREQLAILMRMYKNIALFQRHTDVLEKKYDISSIFIIIYVQGKLKTVLCKLNRRWHDIFYFCNNNTFCETSINIFTRFGNSIALLTTCIQSL